MSDSQLSQFHNSIIIDTSVPGSRGLAYPFLQLSATVLLARSGRNKLLTTVTEVLLMSTFEVLSLVYSV